MITAKEIFELRHDGRIEEAYEAARELYAVDKGQYASSAMFWTAVDVLKARINEGNTEKASIILQALERLMPNLRDSNEWMQQAYQRCCKMLSKAIDRKNNIHNVSEHFQLGVWGEDLAAVYLREKGYVIIDRDWHSGHRDIDIVARKNDVYVFVEVKTRRNDDFGSPEQAIDREKQKNLCRAINHYIKYHHLENPIRFDIITIIGMIGSQNPVITHYENINILEVF